MAAIYNDVCCVSLQAATELVSVVQVIEAVVLCATGTALLTETNWLSHIPGGVYLGFALIVVGLISLVLAVLLYQGSEERNAKKCNAWVYSKIIMILFGLCGLAVSMYNGRLHFYLFLIACNLLLSMYCIFVVWTFAKEIKSDCTVEFRRSGSECEL